MAWTVSHLLFRSSVSRHVKLLIKRLQRATPCSASTGASGQTQTSAGSSVALRATITAPGQVPTLARLRNFSIALQCQELTVRNASVQSPTRQPFCGRGRIFEEGPRHEVAPRHPAARGARAEIAVCVAARG